MSSNSNSVKRFFMAFLAGGAVGAIVALLNTSKSGKKLRGNIKQKSGEYFDEADKYFTETKIKAGEMINEGKRKYAAIKNDVMLKPDEFLKDAQRFFKDAELKTKEVLHSGKEKIETETERLKSSVKAGMDSYNEAKKI
ncbi:MAG: YtxH domain-containing protein [Ignavibacteriaceae bacterium]